MPAMLVCVYFATNHKILMAHKHKLFLLAHMSMGHCSSDDLGYPRSVHMRNSRSTETESKEMLFFHLFKVGGGVFYNSNLHKG